MKRDATGSLRVFHRDLVTVVVLILIAWIAIDYRRQKQRLRELDASGVVRRSGRSAAEVQ